MKTIELTKDKIGIVDEKDQLVQVVEKISDKKIIIRDAWSEEFDILQEHLNWENNIEKYNNNFP